MKPVTISESRDRKYWIKKYEFEGMRAEANAVALMPNGDMVIAGSIKPEGEDAKSSGLVARLDREGNVKWVRIFGGNESDWFNDVKVASNGDIIVAGYTWSFGAGKENFWVLRLDENGNVKWQKTYGGSDEDYAEAVALAPNGDIIVAGCAGSFGAGYKDAWILRLDGEGNIKWQKTYGGEYWEVGEAVAVAPNGDIIVSEITRSFGAGKENFWVLRLDENGNVKWQKTYGGSDEDEARAVAVAENGDIIVAGCTGSFGAGYKDAWILRLDGEGNIKWQKTYGGSDGDEAYAVALAPNGDIIVAGCTGSFGAGKENFWVLRLDENGNVKWQKTYGGSSSDGAEAVALTPSGDIIVAGWTASFGDNTGILILRLPPDGELPGCKICQDSNATVMDTQAVVKNTNCKVTVPPLKPGLFRKKEYVKITNTIATIRTATPKVKVLCEWAPESSEIELGRIEEEITLIDREIAKLFERAKKTKNKDEEMEIASKIRALSRKKEKLQKLKTPHSKLEHIPKSKPCPGYLINGRCYIVKATVMDEAGLKSALEELDKELSRLIQPLPDEITVHPFKGIIEGKNLFVTRSIVSRGPGESGVIPSERLIEILDWIRNTVIPEIEVPEKVARGFMAEESKVQEVKAKTIPKTKTKAVEKVKPAETVEGFPSALLERYEPLEFLGEGGFAKVFKARRREDGKIVALKIPRIDEKTGKFFIKEVASWYQLNHPNIVTLYEANVYPLPYIEMEFVEGVEVEGKLVRDLYKYPKPVDEKTALRLITGIAKGLTHAHSKGIYHLDLKPLNVLLKADLTPKITDWGLAKISARSSLSRHYGYSPLYAAPEQLDEETFGAPDHRTDIYQLGLIFYELLTGELPYKATSPGALVGKILYTKPKPVSGIKEELKRFDGIFEKLLAKKKEERYQSVEEFLQALESLTELEKEKEELRKTSLAMRKSRSREEFERLKIESVRKTVKIAILSAKLNDKAELLAALDDLKFYTRENLDDILNAIAQVELLLKEGIPISAEAEERVKALVLRIENEIVK